MSPEKFFELFVKELESHPNLWSYYKFHADADSFEFRKAYFMQRLEYIRDAVTNKEGKIWDIGCGYGTTALFLVLNGFKVHGTTLEFYYKILPERMKYWSQYGDVSGFTFDYEDLYDRSVERARFDYIIVQDTLHHLEPLQEALSIIHDHLKPEGKLVVIEENGKNIVQRLKLYKQRGNKRVITIYDERLKKDILLGNENIRSLKTWEGELKKQDLKIDPSSVHYVRAYPPIVFKKFGYATSIAKEQQLWRKNPLMRDYFFFGINFIASTAGN